MSSCWKNSSSYFCLWSLVKYPHGHHNHGYHHTTNKLQKMLTWCANSRIHFYKVDGFIIISLSLLYGRHLLLSSFCLTQGQINYSFFTVRSNNCNSYRFSPLKRFNLNLQKEIPSESRKGNNDYLFYFRIQTHQIFFFAHSSFEGYARYSVERFDDCLTGRPI